MISRKTIQRDYRHFANSRANAAANGGIALLFQSMRLVAAVTEFGSFGSSQ